MPVNMPSKVTADAMYDIAKIRKQNRKIGIKSNIPVNKRNQKKKKRGGPIKVDQEEYKRKVQQKGSLAGQSHTGKCLQDLKSKKYHTLEF